MEEQLSKSSSVDETRKLADLLLKIDGGKPSSKLISLLFDMVIMIILFFELIFNLWNNFFIKLLSMSEIILTSTHIIGLFFFKSLFDF